MDDDGVAAAVARTLESGDRSRPGWRHRAIGNTQWAVMSTRPTAPLKVDVPRDLHALITRTRTAQGIPNNSALLRMLLERWLEESGERRGV